MLIERRIDQLNSKSKLVRLFALKQLAKLAESDDIQNSKENVAGQIHTKYSFSPYTPSMAVYMARKFGVSLVGIMDNYTLSGAKEFIKASRILKMTYTVGVEVRADFNINEIKSANIALMGIASKFFSGVQTDLKALRQNQKNNVIASIEGVNKRFKKHGVHIDFKKDVNKYILNVKDKVYLSKYVFLALAEKLKEQFTPEKTLEILLSIGVNLSETDRALIADATNPYYVYDLANVLFDFRELFFARKSYSEASSVVALAHKYGAICAFEYYIKDKKAFSQENLDYNDKLLTELKKMGFDGVCFEPSKMDEALREKFMKKLEELELFPLRLSNVEFPRQEFDFECQDEAVKKAMVQSAYTVVGSEMCENLTGEGFINSNLKTNGFAEKTMLFSKIGRGE